MSESSDTELSKLLPKKNVRYGGTRLASVVSFHNLHYSLQVKENRKKEEKIILNNVSLLDIMSLHKNPEGLTGTVLINGTPPHPNFHLMTGYVEQDDVVMGSLTVRENLTFCAALRLPGHYTKEQRRRRVNSVIMELELHDCAETKVGMNGIVNSVRGVSGGERKRTCVGMELMCKPSILFLDEPTTGLDASTAMSLVRVLARLSRRGYTLILSIHQPRYDIFRLFDTLHLLAKGETVYHGPAKECLHYFDSIGFQCDKFDNPADFFLDVIVHDSCPSPLITRTSSDTAQSLVPCYRQSRCCHELHAEVAAIFDSYSLQSDDVIEVRPLKYPTSWFVQFGWLCWRTSSNLYRMPFVLGSQYFLPMFTVLLISIVFYQIEDGATSGIQDRIGALVMFVLINLRLAGVSMVLFLEEKSTFRHEVANGYYPASAYLFSKIIAYDIPQRLLPLTLTTILFYFTTGLRPGPVLFFQFYLNILLAAYAIGSIAFFIGINTNQFATAEICFSIFFLLQVLFAGFLINITSLFDWLQFAEYLSIPRYALNAASIIEFKDRDFCDPYPHNDTCSSGNQHLTNEGIDYTDWGYWSTQLALVIITLIFWFLCYVSLRRMPKYK